MVNSIFLEILCIKFALARDMCPRYVQLKTLSMVWYTCSMTIFQASAEDVTLSLLSLSIFLIDILFHCHLEIGQRSCKSHCQSIHAAKSLAHLFACCITIIITIILVLSSELLLHLNVTFASHIIRNSITINTRATNYIQVSDVIKSKYNLSDKELI